MFNSTYGAGYRAGMARPKFKLLSNGTRVIDAPVCPFPAWRFISYALWQDGYHFGLMEKLSQPLKRNA